MTQSVCSHSAICVCTAPDHDSCCGENRRDYNRKAQAQPLERIIDDLRVEIAVAQAAHGPMHSPHEGHSVIREELDVELWEHVCADTGRSLEARHEALQVAAMAVRYILDLIDDPPVDMRLRRIRQRLQPLFEAQIDDGANRGAYNGVAAAQWRKAWELVDSAIDEEEH